MAFIYILIFHFNEYREAAKIVKIYLRIKSDKWAREAYFTD